jgi:Recombinase/Resolvase, N terminal domain
LVEAGKVLKGSYLIIENLDRLSREDERTALRLWMDILDHGVNIVQLSPETIFRHERSDMFDIMRAVMELSRGHGESAIKSKRNAAAWTEKKRQARAGKQIMTHRLPAWVEERDGKLCLIPERAAAVRLIYKLSADGFGIYTIARKLEKDKMPPMGASGKWRRPYIADILTTRRTLGELQPCDINGKPDGDPIPDYYPACVTEEEWFAARGAMLSPKTMQGRTGKYVNIFARLLFDAHDGDTFFRQAHPGRPHATALINTSYRNGTAPCRSFPFDTFERAVLSLLREIDPGDVMERNSSAADEAGALEREMEYLRLQKNALEAELLSGDVPSLAAALRKINVKEQSLTTKLAGARRRAAHPLDAAWEETRSLLNAIDSAEDKNDIRLKLRTVLRRIVEEIRVLVVPRGRDRLAAVQIRFTGGTKQRSYLILHRPPRANGKVRREGSWSARPLAEVAQPGDLDLRKQKNAARLEKVLAAIDVRD